MQAKKIEERGVAEVLLQIGARVEILVVDFRHRKAMPAEVAGKLQEGNVFGAHAVHHADGAAAFVGETDDGASRAAKPALQRLHPRRRRAEMLLKQPLKNVHKGIFQ